MKDKELLRAHFMPMKRLIAVDNVEEVAARVDADPRILHLETPLGGWLHMAAAANAVNCARELLRRGVDVNGHYNSQLGGALNEACSCGNGEIVKLLLGAGAVPETTRPDFNPLFSVVQSERPDLGQLLLDAGLDPATEYQDGWNARKFAEDMGKTQMAAWIRSVGG